MTTTMAAAPHPTSFISSPKRTRPISIITHDARHTSTADEVCAGKITRAETVTMINRVLERVPAKELRLLSRSIMLTFPDNNPGDWYYIAIQEASNSHEYQRSVYETTGDERWTKLIDNVDWTKLEK